MNTDPGAADDDLHRRRDLASPPDLAPPAQDPDLAMPSSPDDGGTVTPGTPGAPTPCWPFDQPSISTLRASSKKVFAHYFSPYPLSIDNAAPAQDYYSVNYLQPSGEGDKFAYCGGFIKERPLPQAPRAGGVDFERLNLEEEVRRAAAAGLDGFTFDILSTSGDLWTVLLKLLDAAQAVDPGLHIVLMPDMSATYGGTDAAARTEFVNSIAALASHPSVFRTDTGAIVLAPFAAEARSGSWWSATLQALSAKGMNATLWPVFVDSNDPNAVDLVNNVALLGTSVWGPATVGGAADMVSASQAAHGKGIKWMTPVRPQDERPKDLIYSEANNSQLFRSLWDAARDGDADWAQLITWNDYSESSEISPSSGIQWAIFDLTAYYTTWFKTGVQPAIVRDAVYYFHRIESTTAVPDLSKQQSVYDSVNGGTPSNEIELLAFLTAPATLQIEVNGNVQQSNVGAGIQSFRVPLVEGTPKFRIVRGGATVTSVDSAFPISNSIVYQDMLYRAGGSLSCDRSAWMQ